MKSILRTLNFVVAASVGNYLSGLGGKVLSGHFIIPLAIVMYYLLERLEDRIEKREKADELKELIKDPEIPTKDPDALIK